MSGARKRYAEQKEKERKRKQQKKISEERYTHSTVYHPLPTFHLFLKGEREYFEIVK